LSQTLKHQKLKAINTHLFKKLPLIAVLVTMERNGVELDANALGKQQFDVIVISVK
jgi:DNA polymerase I-like protein with 3'-5' exonuclease and polymerase domains